LNDYAGQLTEKLSARMDELAEQIKGSGNPDAKVPAMALLLKTALKNEWETTLLTSFWVTDEKDPFFRIALARLAGDEAKHFSLIEKRLKEMGVTFSEEELNERTPLFKYLLEQKSTFDRAVTGPFTREALAVARNNIFLEHCYELNDTETIKIYEQIQEDEKYHQELGKNQVAKLINSDSDLKKATEKMLEMLQIVDDIQEMVVMKKGICRIPGC
jgi:rubrerythrin